MRIRIAGRKIESIAEKARSFGLIVDDENYDVVLCHGGDGTLLGAERDFPGAPKLALRPDAECQKCSSHTTDAILKALAEETLTKTAIIKVRADFEGGESIIGMNDIVLHNADPFSAVRFKVWINDDAYCEEIVGDGPVAATPFGSSAYYRSITHGVIRTGLGLAFNNSTGLIDHIVVSGDVVIRVLITRGPAVLGADNDPVRHCLKEGHEVVIRKAEHGGQILGVETLLCNRCSRLDGRKWNRHGGMLSI